MKIFLMIFWLYLLFSVFILRWSTNALAEQLEPKALFEKRCSRCHSLDRTNRTEKPEAWKALVNRMKAKMSSGISDEDAEVIYRYLIENRSKK